MRSPNLFAVQSLVRMASENQKQINGKWIPARPLGFSGFRYRLKCAWLVFTGRADAVRWPEGQ